MVFYILRDPKFDKHLNILREKGGTALLAANKAEEIINKILIKGRENSHIIGKLTKNGEFRIRHCIKYDLGNGYRLVCMKKGSHLVLLYVGTHDDCSRWLQRNRDLQYEIDNNCNNMLLTRDVPSTDFISSADIDPADEYEKQLVKRIDDKVLRNIFCGLCEK
jgi:hypothetical protein